MSCPDPLTAGQPDVRLSARERAVVARIVEGVGVKGVAAEFNISVHTVSTYLLRARRKHNSRSLWRLAALLLGPSPSFVDLVAPDCVDLSLDDILVGTDVLAGLSNREIGCRLGIDETAAGRVVSRLLQKIKLRTRADLFAQAFRRRPRRSAGPSQKGDVA